MKHEQLENKIKDLVSTLRVYVNNDGGDLEYISFINQIVTIKILGACVECPFIDSTFNDGIKNILMSEFPEIIDVKFIV